MNCPIAAVLVHVNDWRDGLAWYRRAFPDGDVIEVPSEDWACLNVAGVRIELVNADEKVSSGAAGTVVYWYTDDFGARLIYLESIGAELYRGPIDIENGQRMCQVKDPFGNLLGIRGPNGRDVGAV